MITAISDVKIFCDIVSSTLWPFEMSYSDMLLYAPYFKFRSFLSKPQLAHFDISNVDRMKTKLCRNYTGCLFLQATGFYFFFFYDDDDDIIIIIIIIIMMWWLGYWFDKLDALLHRKVELVAEEAGSLKESLDRYFARNQRRMKEAQERAELLGRAVCFLLIV